MTKASRVTRRGETDTSTSTEDIKREGRISLCRALFDGSCAGLKMVSNGAIWHTDVIDDGHKLEPITCPDEEVIVLNPWTHSALFTEDSIIILVG